ncbi:MAG: class I SAM-dependent methyltransferase [Nitrospirota bacterium]
MNDTLKFIQNRYRINFDQELPIKLNADRFKELPKLFRKLGFKIGAEIGVATGRYSKVLCQYIQGLKLYCVDPWIPYDGYVESNYVAGEETLNTLYEKSKERLAPYNCEFIRALSMDAVKNFKDNSLDFVFIDANHSFEYVIEDIAHWGKKVRVGGIVSGHDFWNSGETPTRHLYIKNPTAVEKMRLCQVKDAVLAWTKANDIKPWFVTGLDDCSSWFWVKE